MNKKIIAAALACALTAGCLAGCSGTEKSGKIADEDVVLKYWMPLHANVSAVVTDLGQTEYAKELEKRTGVKVQYVHPAAGQETEQFNLLLASDELPDLIESNWYYFPGGPAKAIKDGYIEPLNDLMKKNAPNLTKYLQENPEIDKMVKTDEGQYYVFPFLRGDEKLQVSAGPIVRKDWLDELGLDIPRTYDDWYTMLKAFKEKKGASAPLSIVAVQPGQIVTFAGLFNYSALFYQEDGSVKYGASQPEYKDFLTMMKKWFDEGLLDRNFSSMDAKVLEANVLTGKTGATYGSAGQQLGKWIGILKENDPGADLIGVPFPTASENILPRFSGVQSKYPNNNCVAISTSCKTPDIAAKYLDFGYGEEGHMLNNFGIEGVSYNMVDGYPTYTDEILHNPEGLPINQAMGKYFRASYSGPFVQDKRYIEQYYSMPQQSEAQERWSLGLEEEMKYQLPKVLATEEESKEVSRITNELNTYRSSMTVKFILGTESLDGYDAYVQELKNIGVDRINEIYDEAVVRYEKR